MAEVLSPLSSPSSTVTMLQTRPASSDVFQSSQAGSSYSQPQRLNNTPRTIYGAPTGYRGTSGPVQPYAFQTTPQLRTISSSSVPQVDSAAKGLRHGHRHTASASSVSSDMSSSASAGVHPSPSKDELFSGSAKNSFINMSSSIPDLSLTTLDSAPKSSPNRYRRTPQRLDSSSSINRASVHSVTAVPTGTVTLLEQEHTALPPPTFNTDQRTASDDITVSKSSSTAEVAKRYRRRSLNNLDATKLPNEAPAPQSRQGQSTIRPVSFHSRSSSIENTDPMQISQSAPSIEHEKPTTRSPAVSPAKVPVRNSSANPSPLSRSALDNATSPTDEFSRPAPSGRPSTASPAAQHLAALNDRDLNKGMKSRLRRAFSFGSAAELRRASENIPPPQLRGQTGNDEDLDPEQLEIIRKQEAAGIGAGIYSGQGGFTGSTDNLSISSTASSASIMLRKMGKGMKKGGRSLKGLFRPKSVIGVPAADGPVSSSLAQVSMVTVEAERRNVNVNAHPADHAHGGTGFPKLEKNSMDAVRASIADGRTSADRNESSRKSIVVGDKDRAEVLAAVKRGILKRNGTSSPGTPGNETSGNLSPVSVPATPRDDRTNDYFSGRLSAAMAKSMPSTPSGSRNISFSPRIQFYDAWSSGDYDRRGEIATCNRLTPMLAQQIKEELNTFKMEMEVHELSKPHTHFF